MKRFLAISIPSFVIGAVAGAALWYLFSPLFFDQVVNEELAQTASAAPLAAGQFSGADAVHQGSGMVRVITRTDGVTEVQLSDFEVTNGPDLEVWLSAASAPQSSADVSRAAFLSLGALKGNIGDQAYTLPAGTVLSDYGSVVIWCEQFGVLFASAPLGGA